MTRLSGIVALAVFGLNASTASAQTPLGSANAFAVLAGTAVTCTNSTVTGDVGVWPNSAVTRTLCPVVGTVHPADVVAEQAFMDFRSAYNTLRLHPPACDATVTGPLTGQVLMPGVYCLDLTAKTGTLTLDAQDHSNAAWLFLVKGGALTGANFTVKMINGGQPCNVDWWVRDAATLTDSNFLGTILAGAAITVTRGTFTGHALATAAVTLTGTTLSVCKSSTPQPPPGGGHCDGDDDGHGHHDGDDDGHGHHDGDDDGHGHHDGDHDGHHGDKDHDKDHKDKDHKDKDGKDKKDQK